jgi:mevalonate kinase
MLCSFKSLKFLLTDSRVPRNTKQLVAGVAALKEQEPEFVNGLLGAIQDISDEAQRALADPQLSRQTLLSALSVRCSFFVCFWNAQKIYSFRLSSMRTMDTS